jgi:hypothetical protein
MGNAKRLMCPHCGKNNDQHDNLFERDVPPSEGDVTLCGMCGQWAVFEGAGLAKPSAEMLADIASNEDAQKLLRAWRATVFDGTSRR